MNPNSSGEVQRQYETAPSRPEETAGAQSIEKGPVVSPETSPQRVRQASQAASTIALPGQDITVGTPDVPVKSDDTASSQTQAAEADQIEKEWIDKTQAAVAQTRDDPYEQKKAVSHVKADYIKKRFDKTIKTDDPVSK
jgi:hypothetical protein